MGTAVGRAVADAFKFVVNAITGFVKILWPILSPIVKFFLLPWTLAIGAVHALVTGGFSGLLHYFMGIPAQIGHALSGVIGAITAPFAFAWGLVTRGASTALDGVKNAVTHVIGALKGVWNGFANLWNGVPHIGIHPPGWTHLPSFSFGLPHMPKLAASGAWLTSPTALIGGEAGPELVAPEAMLRRIIRQEAGGTAINLTVNVPPTANPAETGRAVAQVLRAYFRAGGRLQVPA